MEGDSEDFWKKAHLNEDLTALINQRVLKQRFMTGRDYAFSSVRQQVHHTDTFISDGATATLTRVGHLESSNQHQIKEGVPGVNEEILLKRQMTLASI